MFDYSIIEIFQLIVLTFIASIFLMYILSHWHEYYLIVGLLFSLLFGAVPLDFGSKNYNFYYSDIVFVFVVVAVISRNLSRRRDIQRDWTPVAIGPVVLLGGIYFAFSTLSSVMKSADILRALVVLKQVAQGLLLFVAVWSLLKGNEKSIEGVVRSLPLLGLGFAIVTLYSGYVNGSGDLGVLLSWGKSYSLKNLVESYLGRNNYLGGIMAVLLPVSIAIGRTQGEYKRWTTWGCAAAMAVGIVASNSRGAVAALVVTFLLRTIMASSAKTLFRMLAVGLLLFGILFVWYPQAVSDTLVAALHSYSGRVNIWQMELPSLLDNLFVGIGRGSIRTQLGGDFHNAVLRAFLETGILGGLAYVGFLVSICRGLFRSWRTAAGNYTKWLVIQDGVLFSVVVAIIHSLGEPLLETAIYDVIFWSIVGIGYALPGRLSQKVITKVEDLSIVRPKAGKATFVLHRR